MVAVNQPNQKAGPPLSLRGAVEDKSLSSRGAGAACGVAILRWAISGGLPRRPLRGLLAMTVGSPSQ